MRKGKYACVPVKPGPRKAGLDAAVARGRQGGRKPVVTDEKFRRARTLIADGFTVREAVARIKVGKTALYAALAQTTPEPVGAAWRALSGRFCDDPFWGPKIANPSTAKAVTSRR